MSSQAWHFIRNIHYGSQSDLEVNLIDDGLKLRNPRLHELALKRLGQRQLRLERLRLQSGQKESDLKNVKSNTLEV